MARDLKFIKQRKKLEGQQEVDKINHPSHYQKGGKECIDVMLEVHGIQTVIAFCTGNAFKYRWRAGMKKGESAEVDLKKAKWYEDYRENLINNTIKKYE